MHKKSKETHISLDFYCLNILIPNFIEFPEKSP